VSERIDTKPIYWSGIFDSDDEEEED